MKIGLWYGVLTEGACFVLQNDGEPTVDQVWLQGRRYNSFAEATTTLKVDIIKLYQDPQ